MRESHESSFGIDLVSGVSVAIAVGVVALAFAQCHGAYRRVLVDVHEENQRSDVDNVVRGICANGVDAQFGEGPLNTAHKFSEVMREGESLAGFVGDFGCSVSNSGTLPFVFVGRLLIGGTVLTGREKGGDKYRLPVKLKDQVGFLAGLGQQLKLSASLNWDEHPGMVFVGIGGDELGTYSPFLYEAALDECVSGGFMKTLESLNNSNHAKYLYVYPQNIPSGGTPTKLNDFLAAMKSAEKCK
jgi:hypothetical protein